MAFLHPTISILSIYIWDNQIWSIITSIANDAYFDMILQCTCTKSYMYISLVRIFEVCASTVSIAIFNLYKTNLVYIPVKMHLGVVLFVSQLLTGYNV